ncbi:MULTISPECIES: hypothetical protein [Rhodococcus]|uniref:hypothetical protein n=1 Tax=Rhodococcus TaxID=1827 RepID=UPI00110DD09C|nr:MULTISPECIES: hypothetical protein [Rhodococcus]MDO1481499.1 hypothetical protein [Rhodococcus ruber]
MAATDLTPGTSRGKDGRSTFADEVAFELGKRIEISLPPAVVMSIDLVLDRNRIVRFSTAAARPSHDLGE